MGLDDLLISTGVDQLIKLVRDKGKVEIGAAAKEMKLPLRTVEDWAHVLEEEGLITIEYKLTQIYLAWHAPSSDYVAQKTTELTAKAAETKGDVSDLLVKVQQGGKELETMQHEISRLETAQPITPADIQKLKGQLSSLEKGYNESIAVSSEKLEKLKKKVAVLGPKVGQGGSRSESLDIGRELAVLKKFESTLQAQLDDTETFFGAFEARLEDFRKTVEEGKGENRLSEVKEELAAIKSLRSELFGALEAVAEEHKSINARVGALDRKIAEASGKDDTVSAAKKKLADLRRMEEDAKKQKELVTAQLSSALLSVKKQIGRVQEISSTQNEAQKKMDEMKEEYVDIAEEISRAGEELSEKQKEIGGRISVQMAALDMVRGGAASKISKEEIQKVSFLLRELKREQALLEEKVRLLMKESEILRLEAPTAASGSPGAPRVMSAIAAAKAGAPQAPPMRQESEEGEAAFVEKIKLSSAEEGEFERKRDELRSLIRKMWEESKDGSAG